MQFEGAIIREQNVTFAVVIVKKHVIDNRFESERALRGFAPAFPHMPIVLMAQDHLGRPTYYGRTDISSFMARVPLRTVPWKSFITN